LHSNVHRKTTQIVADPTQALYTNPMSAFPVSTEKQTQLANRMASLGVQDSDIEESFVRSGGHGGQNVNKTSTCVMLLHRPSGIQVKCQTTRQQGLNRFIARRLLLDKIEARQRGYVQAERDRIQRIRHQKRRRTRRAQNRVLANKAHQSEKKSARKTAGRPDFG
jgi:peptide chain release factor